MSDEPAKILLGDTAISAIEEPPSSGGRRFFRPRSVRPPLSRCENCGALLNGRFCGQCGQPAVDYRRSFRHVLLDTLDSFLNWDSKFATTMGHLLTRPWKLTNEFLAGHRVRYLNPLRLYLLVSILFFFVVNYAGRGSDSSQPIIFDSEGDVVPGQAREPKPGATPPIDKPGDADSDEPNEVGAPVIFDFKDREATGFEKWMQEKIEEKIGKNGSKGMFFLRSLMKNLPYMMLACIPVFAFILKVLYLFRRPRTLYIDHLIYALHIHSFAYLVSVVIVGIGLTLSQTLPAAQPLVLFAVITTAVIQVFLSIRKVYRQGWFMSLFKFGLGAFAYLFVLVLGLGATTFLTLAMP